MGIIPDKRFECDKCGKEYYRWRESCSACMSSNVIKVKDKHNKNKQMADMIHQRKFTRYRDALTVIANNPDDKENHIRAQEALKGRSY